MPKSKELTVVLLSLLSPGAGYAYYGRFTRAAVALISGFSLVFLFSYLATLSAWFIVAAFAGGFLLVVVVAMDSFRCAISSAQQPRLLFGLLYILVALLCFQYVYLPVRRVSFYVTPSILMEPTLQKGDHFALDRFYSDFKSGDLVVVEMEDQSLVVRRIQEMKSLTVIITTDSKAHSRTDEIPLTGLRGKVLYVIYSENPESWVTQMDRLFVAVN
jgi:signal peptidase I